MNKRTVPAFVPRWEDADKVRHFEEGERNSEVWATLHDYRERCLIETAAVMLAAGNATGQDADLPGLLHFLWGGLDEDEYAEFVDQHRALIEGRAEELNA